MRKLLLPLLLFCLLGVAANFSPDKKPETTKSDRKKIYVLHSDVLHKDFRVPGAQVLSGNVHFLQDGVHMYCDSAHYYDEANSFKAFGHVKMVQGDTLSLVGEYLNYNGATQLAEVRRNVVLRHRKSTLYTDSLNYDRLYNLGYFFEGGKLVDADNTLTSDWGEYHTDSREAIFNYNVLLLNPKFTLKSDTLHYNTLTKMARIVGPSNIDHQDTHIYSESGIYDTQRDVSHLYDRSIITNNDGKKMIGDSVYYDSKKGYGEGFHNVIYTDEPNKNQLTGNYVYYDENTGYAFATDSAVAKDYSQKDTMYIHADTLKMFTFNINTDSVYRETHAYHKVRSYRVDIQMVCDSLMGSSIDSCLYLYKDPIVWNGDQQIVGEEMRVYLNDSTVDSIQVLRQAMSIEKLDKHHYNQVSGREMHTYFNNGEVYLNQVEGNVLAIYYMLDSDSLLYGSNYTETTLLKMYVENRKMKSLWMPAAQGVMYPITDIPADKYYLPGFAWFDYIRPTSPQDILVWRGKGKGQEMKVVKHKGAPLQKLDKILKKE